MTEPTPEQIALARTLTNEQREAILEGRVHDCPYNHEAGTKCPNCARWPFNKGGAEAFVQIMATALRNGEHLS